MIKMSLWQGLPFHSTNVHREFTHTLLMLFYWVVDQTATRTHVRGCYNIFFMVTLKKYFMLKKLFFFFKFKVLYVLKTNFDCFNSQVNKLDDMEREQLFGRQKAILWIN